MMRRLRHLLPAFFLALLFVGLPAQAQLPPPAKAPAPAAPAPVAPGQPPPALPPIERPAPALQYFMAGGSLLLILVIVCMPSRKN